MDSGNWDLKVPISNNIKIFSHVLQQEKIILRFGFLLLLVGSLFQLRAQEQPAAFWDEIQSFRHQDSINPPPKHAILFVGSSSFRMWKDVPSYFPGYTIINRGFGGSSIPDLIHYADDIIFPYEPRQVVIYCGDNDLAASDSVSAEIVYRRFSQLFQLIRQKMPGVNILFVSIKPSPSRDALRPKMAGANLMIRRFLEKQPRARFVDVYSRMLDATGRPMENLFIEDRLHMNAKGYAIWQKAIAPYLLKN